MERECVITGYSTRIIEKESIDKEYSKRFNWEKGRKINLDSKLIQLTVFDALAACDIDLKQTDKSRIGIAFGTAFGSLESYEEFFRSINNNIQPIAFSNSLASIPASIVSIFYGITGPSITLSENYLGGIDSVMLAIEMIYNGLCDIVIAGAWHIPSESSKELVSSQDCGSVVIVIESIEYAKSRSANVLGGIKGLSKEMIKADGFGSIFLKKTGSVSRKIDYVVLYSSSDINAEKKEKDILLSLKVPYSKIKEKVHGVSSLLSVIEGIKKIQKNDGINNVMINVVSDRIVTIFLEKK